MPAGGHSGRIAFGRRDGAAGQREGCLDRPSPSIKVLNESLLAPTALNPPRFFDAPFREIFPGGVFLKSPGQEPDFG
jgi:hypothetical protein